MMRFTKRYESVQFLILLLMGLMLVGCSDLEMTMKSAEKGNAIAQDKLGNMYSKGIRVPVDFKQAVTWWGKAAEQGVASSQANLAFMYYRGDGVQKNNVLAYAWLSIAAAAKGQNNDAEDAMNLVAMSLTPEQLKQAETVALELQAKISRRKP